MNSPKYKISDVVQYNRGFWDYYEDPENMCWMVEQVDSPMIVLKPCITVSADKLHNYIKYTVLQGDKKFNVHEDDVELVS